MRAITGHVSRLCALSSDSVPLLLGHVSPAAGDTWDPGRLREVWLLELQVRVPQR